MHCDRCTGHRHFGNGFGPQRIDPHGSHNVLDALLTPVLERVRQLVADLVSHYSRNTNSTRFRQCLKSCGYINAVAVDVVLFGDHVTEIDTNPEGDAFVLGRPGIAVGHCSLHLSSAAHGVHDTRKFRQKAIASVLYDPAMMLADFRIDQFPEMRFEAFVRPLLIHPHQARIPRHIGGEDRGEAADRRHFLPGRSVFEPELTSKPAAALAFTWRAAPPAAGYCCIQTVRGLIGHYPSPQHL